MEEDILVALGDLAKGIKQTEEGTTEYYCELCDCDLNSESTVKSHAEGLKHSRNLKIQQSGVSVSFDRTRRVNKVEQAIKECQQPILGLDYITEHRDFSGVVESNYKCTLCDQSLLESQVLEHILEAMHRLKYMEVADPAEFGLIKSRDPDPESGRKLLVKWAVKAVAKYGRGKINVEMMVGQDLRASSVLPSSFYSGAPAKKSKNELEEMVKTIKQESEEEKPNADITIVDENPISWRDSNAREFCENFKRVSHCVIQSNDDCIAAENLINSLAENLMAYGNRKKNNPNTSRGVLPPQSRDEVRRDVEQMQNQLRNWRNTYGKMP